MDIEKRSFEIITEILGDRKFPEEQESIIKRVIHTSADFDYADNLKFSEGAVEKALEALRAGCDIVTDTNMALAGVSRLALRNLSPPPDITIRTRSPPPPAQSGGIPPTPARSAASATPMRSPTRWAMTMWPS